MTTITPHQDAAITRLFDAITGYNCLTHEDIATHGGFSTAAEIGPLLALVRDPEVAEQYGWTVPHVRRGRPREDQDYRYIVVGLSGEVLDKEDTGLVQEGALSTVRIICSETRNEAHALLLTRAMVADPKYRKWAQNTAVILNGISAQAGLEVARLESILATP